MRRDPGPAHEGFTILEILIVVGLIGVLTAAVISQVGTRSGAFLDAAAGEMRATLRFAAQSSIAKGQTHRVVIDLGKQRFRIEEEVTIEDEDEGKAATTANLLDLSPPLPEVEFRRIRELQGNWTAFEEGPIEDRDVLIDEVRIGDEEYDDDEVSVAFAGDGGADPAEIWISNRAGHRSGVKISPFTGEVRSIDEDEL